MSDFTGCTETYLGHVNGYRYFDLNKRGTLLGPIQHHPWTKGMNYAQCTTQYYAEDAIPHFNCGCGFYGYHDIDTAEKEYDTPSKNQLLLAVIEASGRCLVGRRGFKAQKAKIAAVHVPIYWSYAGAFAIWAVGFVVFLLAWWFTDTSTWPINRVFWGWLVLMFTAGTLFNLIEYQHVFAMKRRYPQVKVFFSQNRLEKAYPSFQQLSSEQRRNTIRGEDQ